MVPVIALFMVFTAVPRWVAKPVLWATTPKSRELPGCVHHAVVVNISRFLDMMKSWILSFYYEAPDLA